MSFQDMKKRFEPGDAAPQGSGTGGSSPRISSAVPAPVPVPKTPEVPSKRVLPPKPSALALADGTKSLGRSSASKSRPQVAGTVAPPPGVPSPRDSSAEAGAGPGGLISPQMQPAPRTPPPRPPKVRTDALGRSSDLSRAAAELAAAERERQLEKKILELQVSQLQLVEKLATYEQHAHDEMRGSGGNAQALLERPSMGSDLLSKLRRKLEKSQKKKDALEVLQATEEMDAEFWSPKSAKRRVKLDMEKLEILHPLTKDVGGSLCRLFVCEIDGFVCVMKELDIAFAKELNASLVRTFESEVVFLEQLPAHPNIVRYLFHTFDPERGRARLFMTKYALSLRDELVRRKAGIGDVAGGVSWCGCCPKCAVVHAPAAGAPAAAPLYLSLVEAARILLDIAQGLYFLHFHSVLHRDLKSDNIFVKLGPDGEITRLLIGDFDTAKSLKVLS